MARAERAIKESGLSDAIDKMTFNSFITDTPWRERMKADAERYAEDPTGWIIFTGQSGSGKTHLCTAIAGKLMKEKSIPVTYMLWTQEYMKAARFTETEYRKKLRECECLYIDDLFKPSINETQLWIAFEILDARYRENKLTIISTERTMSEIAYHDEALFGRIKQRSVIVGIKKEKGRNFRDA